VGTPPNKEENEGSKSSCSVMMIDNDGAVILVSKVIETHPRGSHSRHAAAGPAITIPTTTTIGNTSRSRTQPTIMNDKDLSQDGDIDLKVKNTTHRKKKHHKKEHHRHKRTSDTLRGKEDLELGQTRRHGHHRSRHSHHSHNHGKGHSKHHRDKSMADLKNDSDYDDFLIAKTPGATHPPDVKHTLASSNRNESLKNKGKRVFCYD